MINSRMRNRHKLHSSISNSVIRNSTTRRRRRTRTSRSSKRPPVANSMCSRIIPGRQRYCKSTNMRRRGVRPSTNHRPSLLNNRQFRVPLVDEGRGRRMSRSRRAVVGFCRSKSRANRSPCSRRNRNRHRIMFTSRHLRSLNRRKRRHRRCNMNNNMPPCTRTRQRSTFRRRFRARVNSIRRRMRHCGTRAPRRRLTFRSPRTFRIKFSNLLPIRRRPYKSKGGCSHTSLTTTNRSRLRRSPLQPRKRFRRIVSIVSSRIVNRSRRRHSSTRRFSTKVPLSPPVAVFNEPQ